MPSVSGRTGSMRQRSVSPLDDATLWAPPGHRPSAASGSNPPAGVYNDVPGPSRNAGSQASQQVLGSFRS